MRETDIVALEGVFEAIPSGLIIATLQGEIIRMNKSALSILHLDPQQSFRHISDFPEPVLALLSVVTDGTKTNIKRAERTILLPDSNEPSVIGYSLQTSPLESGMMMRVLIFSDISRVMKDRLAFDKIREELYQSKKLASIGAMISGVAHELNNPLTGISMSAELTRMTLERLKRQLGQSAEPAIITKLDAALREIQKVDQSAKKGASLVSDLLGYSRPSKLNLQMVPLISLVEEVTQAILTHPEFSQVQILLTLPDPEEFMVKDACLVLVDRVKLEQVFYNLYKNACDATGGKGVIRVSYHLLKRADKTMIRVDVADNGPGIDTTALERVFEPFFSTKGVKGVGLGLSISHRTVEQHGGALTVTSKAGEGAIFHVALPLTQKEDLMNE
ncbi:MAG: PAS domain-containing protein [Cyanobacteria bacterium]|nr:PAS domain-containing protein [Cyanobacteriota bacterium]